MTARSTCRACGGSGLESILDLGELPLADGFVDPTCAPASDARFPVHLVLCSGCGLAQLRDTVPREILFGQGYPYYSSYSTSWLAHASALADRLCRERALTARSRVVELASNDGYLLRRFVERGIPALGVEPAPGPAAAARELGVETLDAFFDASVADALVADGWRADVVIANNVLAHVEDLAGFVAGVRTLLTDDGIAVLEFGYLGDLVRSLSWDTLYHEHLCVFSLGAAISLFDGHGLTVRAVERLSTQGGSLRIVVARGGEPDATVRALLEEERRDGLARGDTYGRFGTRVAEHVHQLAEFLHERTRSGRRIAAYGAAAKGTVLLNVLAIGPEVLSCVADRNPHKQGWLVPGVRIPIVAPAALRRQPPDDLLVLPWNLRDEIIAQERWLAERGGRFLLPLPHVEAVAA